MIQTLWRRGRDLCFHRQWQRVLLGSTLALSLGLLILGLARDWTTLTLYEWQFDWVALILSGVAYSLCLVLAMSGWIILMRTLCIESTWRQDAKFFLQSWIARRLPTPAPYFASRVLLYENIGTPKRLISIGLLWENILLITSGAILVLLLFPISPLIQNTNTFLPILVSIMVIIAGGLPFLIKPSILVYIVNQLLHRLGKDRLTLIISPRAAFVALTVYMLVWVTGGLILFLLIRSIYSIENTLFLLVVQAWIMSGLISNLAFFMPFGFGIREVTLATLLSLIIPLSTAIVITLLVRFWIAINELLWAMIVQKL